MSDDIYRVVVTREDGHWLADVPSLEGAHTYARSLPTLDQAVREVVVLGADLPDEGMPSLAEMVGRGPSVRDVAALLGISPQRVSQLTARAS